MSYTYLEVRDFIKSEKHLNKLKLLMDQEDKTFHSYLGRYTGIDSFLKVFNNQIIEGIDSISKSLENHYAVLNLREKLNLVLNLSALLLVNQNIKKSNQVINKLNKSDIYYQENMGREWLLRKEMVRTLILIDLTHIDLAEKNIGTLIQWGGTAIHQFKNLGFTQECPNTDKFFERCIMPPMNIFISDDDVHYVCDKIIDFYGRSS